MESNWRWNAWELGWANSYVRLASRIRSGPGVGTWIGSGDRVGIRDFMYVVEDNPIAGVVWDTIVVNMGPGFPWGIDVDPD